MEAYFRERLHVESKGPDALRGSLTFPPDLQGPPETGHGGGVAAMLFEMVRVLEGEQGGSVRVPRPVRVEATLHRELPLNTPLVAEVVRAGAAWRSRILRGDRPVAEAEVRPMAPPLPPLPSEVRREWEAVRGDAHEVPGYAYCLGCGPHNPRGAQVRFDYNERLVWKRLVPQDHFRCFDGSLFPGYLCIVCDELGWWLGVLRQGECGLSNQVAISLGDPVAHGVPLLAVGLRSAVATSDRKGRIWQTRVAIVTAEWEPVASAEVQFVGSPAFTKVMLPRFLSGNDAAAVQRAFPRYAGE